MAVSTETIEAYFKQLDWPFQRRDEHNWSTGFKGDTYEFNFYVRTTDDLVVYLCVISGEGQRRRHLQST